MLNIDKDLRHRLRRHHRNRHLADRPSHAGADHDLRIDQSRWFDPTVGRWLSEDPSGLGPDVNRDRYCGNAPTGGRDPSGLSGVLSGPERTDVEERAAEALDALVRIGRITRQQVFLRKKLIHAALNHQMGFDSKKKPDPAFYDEKNGKYVLRRHKVCEGVHNRVYGHPPEFSWTGCTRAVQTLMIEALSQLAQALGESKQDAFDEKVSGKDLDVLFPSFPDGKDTDYQKYNGNLGGLDPEDFIPGDRVRMPNHMFDPLVDPVGNEGSNVIYLGEDLAGQKLFLHMDGATVDTLDEMKLTMQGYSVTIDPNLDNYKFTERYQPQIPPCLQQN